MTVKSMPTTREIMSDAVVTVSSEATCREAAKLIATHRVSSLPIVDDQGCLLAAICETDLMVLVEDPVLVESNVLSLASYGASTVEIDAPITEVLSMLRDTEVVARPLMVMEGDQIAGIISPRDVLVYAYEQVE